MTSSLTICRTAVSTKVNLDVVCNHACASIYKGIDAISGRRRVSETAGRCELLVLMCSGSCGRAILVTYVHVWLRVSTHEKVQTSDSR